MTGTRGFDLDGETTRAWSTFARRLADDVAGLSEGETLVVALGGRAGDSWAGRGGATFTAIDKGLVRYSEQGPEGAVDEQIIARADADTVSVRAARRLREVLGVVHPAFLQVSGDGQRAEVTTAGAPVAEELLSVVNPADSAQLLELAAETVTEIFGYPPARDDDGDIVIELGSARLYIRVLEQAPVVQIVARLVHHVERPYAAPALVSQLNAEHPIVKFVFTQDAVLASVHVPALPFVAAQLRSMLATFGELADTLGDEIVRRVGGQRAIEPGDDDVPTPDSLGALPPELMMLVRLDPEGRGLDAEITARVCSHDRALARQLLHIAGGQESVWRAAAEERGSDPGQVTKCVEEAAAWTATRRSLASALRLIDQSDG